ncbi:Uncharacterised protein [Salmonella enterica subsp. enterica serovar Typhimurium str. DT104]|nr:Uncharacterised protein [Salmonella enterica subsp. enterica serovar Typhimurium str. DT104]
MISRMEIFQVGQELIKAQNLVLKLAVNIQIQLRFMNIVQMMKMRKKVKNNL